MSDTFAVPAAPLGLPVCFIIVTMRPGVPILLGTHRIKRIETDYEPVSGSEPGTPARVQPTGSRILFLDNEGPCYVTESLGEIRSKIRNEALLLLGRS